MKGFPELIIRQIEFLEAEILVGLIDEDYPEEKEAIIELIDIKFDNILLEI